MSGASDLSARFDFGGGRRRYEDRIRAEREAAWPAALAAVRAAETREEAHAAKVAAKIGGARKMELTKLIDERFGKDERSSR